ncbi:uncharacterized protein [Haliotis cracherodii]|uniref:uncharacterized protein n=1 Tax=Haliotis cracherodii TaxID=6455 RepID=UPI0039ED512A
MFSTITAGFTVVFCMSTCSYGDFPFRNTSLSWEARVEDLVGRLTLEEIVLQMTRGGVSPINGPTPPVSRLGIGPYSWDTECLRGDVKAGNATSFPEPIGLAASFDPKLIFRVAEATSIEVRAKYNNFSRHGVYGTHRGISCLSPVINILRDPRWGRNPETYGECPYLTGVYATQFVHGLQGNHPRYIRANAGCKHFDAYGGPENIPIDRHVFNAKVSERDWRTTFLPAFRACVKAGTYNIMCSYNSVNGVPSCANKRLLTDILRKEWGFTGYVISDQGATEQVMTAHNFTNSSVDTAASCVAAGLNLEISDRTEQNPALMSTIQAVQQGKLSEDLVRERVKPLFYTRMRLGEFDPPEINPYAKLKLSVIESRDHRALAIEAAMKSFVLLKNENSFLPLKEKYNTLAAVGPMVFQGKATMGGYAPDTDPSWMSLTVTGLADLATHTRAVEGCSSTACMNYNSSGVAWAVAGADIVFVTLGLGSDLESEGNDRPDLQLPDRQFDLLADAVYKSGSAPVVVLLFNAGPLNMTWAMDQSRIKAILEVFYPAQATGEALRRVLANDGPGAVPAGRLPNTWPFIVQNFTRWKFPAMTDYSMHGRTYRYTNTNILFPFGYGLSYSRFRYTDMEVKDTVQAGQEGWVKVTVENLGPYDADEVVQVYIAWTTASVPTPRLQLTGFDRVTLASGTNMQVNLTIASDNMALWQGQRGWVIGEGTLEVYVGGQQPNQTRSVGSEVLHQTVHITGVKALGRY